MRTSKPIILEYSFPDIGKITATLHAESAEIYNFLKAKGEIDRLEHRDHLGKLRVIHKSAHHSRWEYVMLQLFFIDTISKSSKVLGLSQSVQIKNHNVSSAEELLKSWVLLLNFSHVEGIFDAERVWLELFLEDTIFLETFVKTLKAVEDQNSCRKVIEAENFYGLSKYFGLALLHYFKKRHKQQKTVLDSCISILQSYISHPTPGSKLAFCRNIFERIRKFTFVILDLNYCMLGIKINPLLFLKQIQDKPAELLYDNETSVVEHIEALEKMLFQNVYAEPNIVKYRLQYLTQQKVRFYTLIKKESQKYLRTSPKQLCEKIHNALSQDFGKVKQNDNLSHYLRFELLPDKNFPRQSVRYYTEQKWLDDKTKLRNWHFVITPVAFTNRSGCFLDVFNSGQTVHKDEIVVIWTLTKYLSRYFSDYAFDSFIFEYETAKPTEHLFEHVLRRLLKPNYKIKFEKDSNPTENNVKLIKSIADLRPWRRDLHRRIARSDLHRDRKLELTKLNQLIRRERKGIFLIACSQIRIFDQKSKAAAEFDGAYIHVLKNRINLVLLEAKRDVSKRFSKQRMRYKMAWKNHLIFPCDQKLSEEEKWHMLCLTFSYCVKTKLSF